MSELILITCVVILILQVVDTIITFRGVRAVQSPAVMDPVTRFEERRAAVDSAMAGLLDDLRDASRAGGGKIHIHDLEVILTRRKKI